MRSIKGAMACALAAWVTVSVAGAGAARAEPVKIRIGWIVTPQELSPIMFAKDGVARHNGVSYTVESVHFQGSTLQMTALQSGDLEIAALGSNSFPLAVQNAGMSDLRIIADEVRDVAGWNGPEYRVLKDGPIKTVEDLKGKVVATNVYGGVSDIAVKAMMLKHRMVVNRDYTDIEIPMPQMSAVLLERKADLVNAVHPFDLEPSYLDRSRVLFTTPDALGPFEVSMWTARAGYIASHRAVLTDLLEDYVRAFRWYLDPAHRAEAVRIVSGVTKVPTALYESWLFVPQKGIYYDPDAKPDLDAVTSNIREEHELGLVKADLEAKDYADLSLLKEAIARLK
ncbi:MAG TPA: ABC transporter substrate-binding protein [Stellaceae bacterium]|nr:ABC transporter substrate-binding protein [Stellaceae bacterium]